MSRTSTSRVLVGQDATAARGWGYRLEPTGGHWVWFLPSSRAGRPGGLPERPMGADCKSVAKATEVRILYPPQSGLTSINN
ncbi:hypothetical protein [Alloactinosynnema sp. L-07]|nr:hypothetical protein [Alloactinosynnema sp. L-07]